jgi:tetratricopeptide (TPR) repeat protein
MSGIPPAAREDLAAGLAHHRAGALDRAGLCYRRALRRAPDFPDALHLLGLLHYHQGESRRAIELIGRALAAMPDFADGHMNLANALNDVGETAAAEAAYRRAIALDAALAPARVNLAMLLNETGRHAEAEAECRAALAARPGLVEAHITLAEALRALGRAGEAEEEYRRAVGLNPKRAETLNDLATLLSEMGRHQEAMERHRRALALEPNRPRLLAAMGTTLARAGDHAGAETAFARVIAEDPLDLPVWVAHASVLAGLGRFEAARGALDHVLRADPGHAEAYWRYSMIGGPADEAGTRRKLEDLAGEGAGGARWPLQRAMAGFALAALRERAGEYGAAFAAAAAANATFRGMKAALGQVHDPDAFDAAIDRLIAATPRAAFAEMKDWGDPSTLPVFIVGMPRAGLTLLEQMLAGHPDIHAAGELARIGLLSAALAAANRDKGSLAEWDAAAARRMAGEHVAGLAALAGGKARVLDRTADNVLQLGLIAALFPAARVLLVARDPRDVCISNFFQLFLEGNLFARDLVHCARRVRALERLGAHWMANLPRAPHIVRYEGLVTEPEAELRAALAHLGLGFHPACLDNTAIRHAITSPAAWQARQKLDGSRIGIWRHYADRLPAEVLALAA